MNRIVRPLLAIVAFVALAQPVLAQDPALDKLIEFAEGELERGTRVADPNAANAARENRAHIHRMVRELRAHASELGSRGIDVNVAIASILYSDLGKNAEYLDAHARKMFPELYADEKTRGLAKFKAFLLHEEPGIDLVKKKGAEFGLSPDKIVKVVGGIVGHNGPSVPGSWWAEKWNSLIATEKPRRDSRLVGREYPMPSTPEATLHTVLDRLDQGGLTHSEEGWVGGPKKILVDLMNQGQPLEAAAREALGSNPDKTLPQLEALRKVSPEVFELGFVKKGEENLRLTKRLLDRIEFAEEGKLARVKTPAGVVEARDAASLFSALSKIPPSSLSTTSELTRRIRDRDRDRPVETTGIRGVLEGRIRDRERGLDRERGR